MRKSDFMVIGEKLKTGDLLYDKTLEITAPSLLIYVSFVLNDALTKGLKRVYFLARDGFPMYEIAKILCKEYNLDIDCRYLYCSRMSLKSALIVENFEVVIRETCVKSTSTTYLSILKSLSLSDDIIDEIFSSLMIENKNLLISESEILNFCEKILEDIQICDKIIDESRQNIDNILGYFEKNGLFEHRKVAIVDSGWSGTMQSAILDLLSKKFEKTNILGYYVGLYKECDAENSKHIAFLFDRKNKFHRSYTFNNNLFECLCSANHGMTLGYVNEIFEPLLSEFKAGFDINTQLKAVCDYVVEYAKTNDFLVADYSKECYEILSRLMMNPSFEEAELYGKIKFCDDPSENVMRELASKLTKNEFKANFLLPRIKNKLSKKTEKDNMESFWYIATAKRFYPKMFLKSKINFYLVQFIYYKVIKNT